MRCVQFSSRTQFLQIPITFWKLPVARRSEIFTESSESVDPPVASVRVSVVRLFVVTPHVESHLQEVGDRFLRISANFSQERFKKLSVVINVVKVAIKLVI